MVRMEIIKDQKYYQSRSMKVLSPAEQDLYLNADRQQIAVEVLKADHEYIKANGLNMQRIVLFLVHEWLAKKRAEWEIHADPDQ